MSKSWRFVSRAFPEVNAGGFSRLDGTVQFYTRIDALLCPETVLLDFGAGRGSSYYNDGVPFRRALRDWRGRVGRAIGADIDPVVTTNPLIDDAIVLPMDGTIPLPDDSVDLIVADYVFEHLPDPSTTSAELRRILKSGGWICTRTPNLWNYVAIANRLLPGRVAAKMITRTQPNRASEDVFEAFYRLNTRSSLRRYFSGFALYAYSWDAEPAYHAGSAFLFNILRVINALSPAPMKTTLIAFMQKIGEERAGDPAPHGADGRLGP